ncbi:cyclic nucleotide-binding domain-containing protein [Anaerotignum sp.]|uniref:cyclic nucleotide-binding domain-containing protein n=1 Tax=Anaerotignum sp. TaxID=2039241 RepID=UPI0028A6C0B6|nr:cyclic nucleotide-binding domain-containing protein [Anaerotignum sp.]
MVKHPISGESNADLKEFGLDCNHLKDCAICSFESGEVILNQGNEVEYLFIVLRGKIKVCMLAPNGKDLTLCYYISSGILGDVEFVQENKFASATSIAAFACDCIRIPVNLNREYLIHNITFLNQLASGLSTKLLNSSFAHITSALYSGEERLCSYILMAEHNQMFTEILSDVSKSIGISYRHLFRLLNDMCERGVLKKSASGFIVLDRQYLTEKCARM